MTSGAISLFDDGGLASPPTPLATVGEIDGRRVPTCPPDPSRQPIVTPTPYVIGSSHGEECSSATITESWERGRVFIERFTAWCGTVDVDKVPVEAAVDLIAKLGHMNNAINGLRLGLTAHVDQETSPPLPEPLPGQNPVRQKVKPLPGDQPDLTGLLQSAGGQPRQRARDEIRQARAIRDAYPLFGQELRRGTISSAHIDVLSRRIPAELIELARSEEATLLELALQGTFEQFVKGVQAWVVKYAPSRAERRAREEARKEKFSVFLAEGGYRLHGWLNAINGIHLDKTLRALVGVPPVGDRREFAERNADALVAILNGEDPSAVSTASADGGTGAGGLGAGAGGDVNADGGTGAARQSYSRHAADSQVNTRDLSGNTESGYGPQSDTSSRSPGTGSMRRSRVEDRRHSSVGRHNPRTHIVVHVPLATLVQTEKAIESGCRSLDEVSGGSKSAAASRPRRTSSENGCLPTGGQGMPSGKDRSSPNRIADAPQDRSGNVLIDESGPHAAGGLKKASHTNQGKSGSSCGVPEPSDGNHHPLTTPPTDTHLDQLLHEDTISGTNVDPNNIPAPKCFTSGAGLGRQGKCLDGREEITAQLGRALTRIRAGIDASMLEGFTPATLEDGTALTPSQLAAMLCDSRISRVVLTAHGEPLDASRAQRLFSATQAKAILARDHTCRYPGCDRGIEVGEIHHAQEWEEGGTTTVDNAVLLCWRHHQAVHQNSITIHHHAGGFIFTKPDGALLGVRRHDGQIN